MSSISGDASDRTPTSQITDQNLSGSGVIWSLKFEINVQLEQMNNRKGQTEPTGKM